MKYRYLLYPLIGFLTIYLFELNSDVHTYEFILSGIISTFYTFILWEGNQWIVSRMKRKYSHYTQTSKRIISQSIASLTFTFFAVISISVLINLYFNNPLFDLSKIYFSLRPSLIATFTITTFSEASYFFGRWKTTILEAEQLKRAHIQSQYETLKNQVNPHFLFNSLNTLITIIPENPQMAVEFVQKLSNVYRYILQIKDKEAVTLAQEMKIAEAYLFLLKSRFGNNLCTHIAVPENMLNFSVIPLSIQILLENAIKHNIVSTEKPLQVDIFIEEGNMLVIRNNLQRKTYIPQESTHTGLENITSRYRLLSQKEIIINETTSHFTVKLPLLTIEKREYMLEA